MPRKWALKCWNTGVSRGSGVKVLIKLQNFYVAFADFRLFLLVQFHSFTNIDIRALTILSRNFLDSQCAGIISKVRDLVTLDQLKPGQRALVEHIHGEGSAVYQRLMEMGVFASAEVEVIRFAPLGDPMELRVQGYNLSVRKIDAKHVEVKVLN